MTLYKHKHLLKLAIILPLFFGFFLGFNNGNAFALEDKTVILSSNTTYTSSDPVFPNCDQSCISQYKFLIVKRDRFDATQSRRLPLLISYAGGTLTEAVPGLPEGFVFQDFTDVRFSGSFTPNSNYVYTLILSNSLSPIPEGSLSITENGTYDVSDYASVSVSVDQTTVAEIIEDPISNDFQKVFFKIVENIIPAFGILLVVWFGIDMLSSLIFGRGR